MYCLFPEFTLMYLWFDAMSKDMDILKKFKAECNSLIHFNFLLYFYLFSLGHGWFSFLNIAVGTYQSPLSID